MTAKTHAFYKLWGTVTDLAPGAIRIAGISTLAGVGNEIIIEKNSGRIYGEILTVSEEAVTALLYSQSDTIRIGDVVHIEQEARIAPGDHWLGEIVNYRGELAGRQSADRNSADNDSMERPLRALPLPAHLRRRLGPRLETGWMITDTLLPICRGQRVGLFAGSGVGKSTFLGSLAGGLTADRVVIALIGERSREVGDFVEVNLPRSVRDKTVIVAATASEPAGAKKRAAYCAIATAEHFRDQGHNVLFLFDSITRFAEAHREVALIAGETPALNAYPPSTVRVIAELAERTGPGAGSKGDITAVFSVLVAGSDLEEPVADMIRGILDGHIILSRPIAERGRYPAIDVLKSVSRALPTAASPGENELLRDYRRNIALYEEVAPMLRANLFEFGRDEQADRAIALYSALDGFAAQPNPAGLPAAFEALGERLNRVPQPAAAGPPA